MIEEKYHFEKNVFSRENYEFQFKEDEDLIEEILKFKEFNKILDLGCGEGGNCLKLAELGFDVTCIDISKTAIEQIKIEAKKRDLNINAVCADLNSYQVKNNYDIILSTGLFHFISKKRLKELLKNCKENTNKKGLNIFEFLLEGDPSQETDSEGYYPKSKELKELYSDWTIIEYEEKEEFDENEDWNSKIGFLIARKN